MKLCRTDQLKEGDIIARAVLTKDYQILLSEGTVLKMDYISKLQDFKVDEVYLQDDLESAGIQILKKETEDMIRIKVKDILQNHTYQHNRDLEELAEAADNIITDILSEEKVMEQVLDIKERSADIYEHSINTCTLSILTAMKMNMSMNQIHNIGTGSLLHDIGLRYLTISYENQNIDDLKEKDKVEFRKHPIYGYTALKDEMWISECSKNIILYHHERLDGSGFPLKAATISKECQIVSVCDVFDEMISGIGCIRAKVHEAVEYLKYAVDNRYQKEIVETFLKMTAAYPIGTVAILNNGCIAVVIRQNKQFPERPVLKLLKKENGQEVNEEILVDLLKQNHIFIEQVL